MNKSLPKQTGFALIEIVMVLALVGLMALLVMNLPSSFSLNRNSSFQNTAKQIASQKIEDLRLQGYANLANGTTQIQDTRLSSLPQANAQLVISDCPPAICTHGEEIKNIAITISWVEKSTLKTTTFNTLISEGGLK